MNKRLCPIKGKAWQHLSFEQRFKASYKVDKNTGCWIWIAPGSQGYGGISLDGKGVPAHRAAWLFYKGPIPNGLFVLHNCDNRACVNYKKHLYLGTKKQNRADFMQRHPKAREIVLKAAKNGARHVRKFWRSMTPKQRKEFCERRLKIQLAKNGGHGPRFIWK